MVKVTIKDVAKEAGVAISTVSNALNNSDLVSEETKARVLEARRTAELRSQFKRTLSEIRKKLYAWFSHLQYWRRLFYSPARSHERPVHRSGLHAQHSDHQKQLRHQKSDFRKTFRRHFWSFQGERIQAPELELLEKHHIKTVFLDRAYKSDCLGAWFLTLTMPVIPRQNTSSIWDIKKSVLSRAPGMSTRARNENAVIWCRRNAIFR